MHESTVSRVTSGKYVQTPRGVFELKYFFSTGLMTDDGEAASSRKIKARIAEIIEKEDKRKPLSDQTIAKMLKETGFQVARRTVAKYRDRLGLLPARMRKQY
jgi:RNA polymerase sigma-54 factor